MALVLGTNQESGRSCVTQVFRNMVRPCGSDMLRPARLWAERRSRDHTTGKLPGGAVSNIQPDQGKRPSPCTVLSPALSSMSHCQRLIAQRDCFRPFPWVGMALWPYSQHHHSCVQAICPRIPRSITSCATGVAPDVRCVHSASRDVPRSQCHVYAGTCPLLATALECGVALRHPVPKPPNSMSKLELHAPRPQQPASREGGGQESFCVDCELHQ